MSTVLIVDDKPENLYLLQALLTGNGFMAFTAGNGAQALELARASAPDVIVSDILMPGMDGFALCREWKKDPSLSRIPFIFYTATYTDSRDEKLALDLGADRFLVKPLEPDVLLGEIWAVLEATSAAGTSAQLPRKEEEVVMCQYNQALVRKLEEKLAELEEASWQRDENEYRLEHINHVLRAVRGVNRLITKEDNRERLIQGACENLIEALSYSHAWITLIDENGAVTSSAQAATDTEAAMALSAVLARGELPRCARRAFETPEIVSVPEPVADCPECPLRGVYDTTGGVSVRLEFDGVVYGVLSVARPIRQIDDTDEYALFLELASDLAFALRKIELAELHRRLERRNEQYARIVTNSRDAMALINQDYVYLEVNPAYAALVNRPSEKIVGYTMSDVLGEEYFRQIGKVHMDQCLAGDTTHFEVSRDVAGSGLRHISATYSPCRTPEGEVTAIAVNINDITERKRAEEALRASEEKYRAMVENVGIGVSLISPNMEILELNQQMREWFPLASSTEKPFCYRSFSIPSRDEICEDCPTFKTLQDGAVHEARISAQQDGGVRNFRVISSPVRDSENRVIAAIEMVEDITEKLSLEAQLRQAQKLEAVGQLAGGVAHDFNNLLMGVMGYVSLCQDELVPDHPIREWLDEISNDVQRSANLTRQLLAFARKQAVVPKVLDLNDTIVSMRKLLRRLIGEDIELNWIPAADPWLVRIDPSQIDQILANLCVNARDAIGGVGKVTVMTENVILDDDYCALHAEVVPGAYVMLAVSDTGCGMDRSTLEHIFEPFFTTKEVGQGTGLGLATVHGIVKQNHGHITVYSEPGSGTTFRIYLPRFEGKTSRNQSPGAEAPRPGGNETILLAEDEKSIRVTTALFLDSLGYAVLTAETPDHALTLAAEHAGRIHLLITDVIMPGISGRDLADRLKEDYPNMRCLFMSGYTADVIAHRGILAEGVDFLSKPFTRDILARKVREVLDREC